MSLYQFCDVTINSNLPLPELMQSALQGIVLTFKLLPPALQIHAPRQWVHCWQLPNERPHLFLANAADGYLLHFTELANFAIDANSAEIKCEPLVGVPMDTIRHLLLDNVLPLLLSHRGRIVLHASAVLTPFGAVAFLGNSGWGKSTVAAGFGQCGFELLTDDCLLLEERAGQYWGIPSYAGLRLLPDSIAELFPQSPQLSDFAHYSRKKRLVLAGYLESAADRSVPLQAVYLLSAPEETRQLESVSLVRLSSASALMALVKHSFRLDLTDHSKLRQEFSKLGSMSETLPVFSLAFPRKHSYLPTVREALLKGLSNYCQANHEPFVPSLHSRA